MKWILALMGIALVNTASAAAISDPSALTSCWQTTPHHPHPQCEQDSSSFWPDLLKRKGGGGSGGRGSSGGSSSSSGSKTGSSGSTGSAASSGGRTTTGSGAPASYGGGRYGGGATVPYRAGGVSPLGLAAVGLFGVGLLSLAFWPGWAHPAYLYPYSSPWHYHNATTNADEAKPVTCGCDAYQVCGCDDDNSTEFVTSVLGDGSYANLNKSLVTVANVNGTDTVLVNGTLPNGTTAAGETESPSAGAGMRELIEFAGWWPAALTVVVMAL